MEYSSSISKMTLGTVQLGLNYGISNSEGKPDEEKAFRIIDSALGAGVNCLDTAAAYGDSENVIGKYLTSSGKRRSEITIVTKFQLGKISASDVEIVMMRSVEKSLKNLNTDYLDILLIHDAKEFSAYGNRITKVCENLLDKGIIRVAGASCYEFDHIDGMLENEIYQAFQIPVNILDMRITKGTGAGRLKNKLVFARSVYLQGLFFLNPLYLKGNLREIAKYLAAIKEISAEMNISVAQLAVYYVNSLKYINSLVIGADNPEQVLENTNLIDSKALSQETINMIEEKLKGAPDWLFIPSLWDRQKEE
jgi:aryl-alcohol dehydrogenase-like predicted oxidoreductase